MLGAMIYMDRYRERYGSSVLNKSFQDRDMNEIIDASPGTRAGDQHEMKSENRRALVRPNPWQGYQPNKVATS